MVKTHLQLWQRCCQVPPEWAGCLKHDSLVRIMEDLMGSLAPQLWAPELADIAVNTPARMLAKCSGMLSHNACKVLCTRLSLGLASV